MSGFSEAELRIFPDAEQMAAETAQLFRTISTSAGEPQHICLSGGSTPLKLFKLLSAPPIRDHIDWEQLHFWWGDERCVPPEDDQSNYGQAHRILFSTIPIPETNIHPMRGDRDAEQESVRYARELERELPLRNGLPSFRLILLGLGSDGHTASLFPGAFPPERREPAFPARHPESGQMRITLSPAVLNNGEELIYLVTGKGKAGVLKEISTYGDSRPDPYPGAAVYARHGRTRWFLDEELAAAAGVRG
ncbi:6-phosphogluconolactonase [Salinispira pacifica]|uniref:6-phosphogluconolactonase n=1 Tax=Salinispira pacifica TaxID=1307761 RepID=V5WIT7_9SPIO|nr:6-phosphogluconolactonase [Salinispira pacifica]AHC15520.1 6-phosphogluconolactonase, eukaryotic type [Salinispira pacifica]